MRLKRAQICRDLIRDLPNLEHIKDKDALSDQLQRQQEQEKDRAEIYRRIAAQKQPKRFLQYCLFWTCGSAPAAISGSRRHIKDATIATARSRPIPHSVFADHVHR